MSFDVPEDRRYLSTHEWALREEGTVRVGISDFAQDELDDVVFVELPDEGEHVDHEATFAVVESIKVVQDVYAPVSGTVTAANDDLIDRPELLNEDPYGDGWLIAVEPDDETDLDRLLSPDEYRDQIA